MLPVTVPTYTRDKVQSPHLECLLIMLCYRLNSYFEELKITSSRLITKRKENILIVLQDIPRL